LQLTSSTATASITGNMVVNNVDYDALNSNPTIKDDFMNACKDAIASNAGTSANDVEVSLSQGSVKVDYTIEVPTSSGDTVVASLESAVKGGVLAAELTTALNDMSAINTFTTGIIGVADRVVILSTVYVQEGFTTAANTTTTTSVEASDNAVHSGGPSATSSTTTQTPTTTVFLQPTHLDSNELLMGQASSPNTQLLTTTSISPISERPPNEPRMGQDSLIVGVSASLAFLVGVGDLSCYVWRRRARTPGLTKDGETPSPDDLGLAFTV